MLEELFNPISIVLHMINALILFAAIRIWLYKPIRAFLDKRKDAVQKTLDDASARETETQQLLNDGKLQLESAQKAAAETIDAAADRGQQRADEIIEEAQQQAKVLLEKARDDGESIRRQARESMEEEAAHLAIQIASKVLEREVSYEDNQRIIEEFLEEVG